MLSRAPLGLAAAGVLLMGGAAAPARRPGLIWNATASAPVGLYRLGADAAIARGDLVAVRPPAALGRWLDARGYAPAGVLLVKRVAGLAPSTVCRQGGVVSLDGVAVARAQAADRRGRALPVWRGCRRLTAAEVFLLNPAPGSLDGRYFGPLPRSAVVGRLSSVWLPERAGDAD